MRIKNTDSVECCKGITGLCKNGNCIHWHQHYGRIDARNSNERCTMWHWCEYIKAKVRCLSKNYVM